MSRQNLSIVCTERNSYHDISTNLSISTIVSNRRWIHAWQRWRRRRKNVNICVQWFVEWCLSCVNKRLPRSAIVAVLGHMHRRKATTLRCARSSLEMRKTQKCFRRTFFIEGLQIIVLWHVNKRSNSRQLQLRTSLSRLRRSSLNAMHLQCISTAMK